MDNNSASFAFKEKRKWQLALRRYLLLGYGSYLYAPYFGIDAQNFRKWIELQFGEQFSWENFSSKWQFEHIVPLAYFDLTNQDDLKLCWNFTNIRIEKNEPDKASGNSTDVLTAKFYFEDLYQKTNYSVCKKMVEKINALEHSATGSSEPIENFLLQNNEYLETILDFSVEDYNELNNGKSFEDILAEQALIKKFG